MGVVFERRNMHHRPFANAIAVAFSQHTPADGLPGFACALARR